MKSKKHVLIVDDVTTNLKCLSEVLKDNYVVSTAKSGEKALDIMDKVIPDLVLMDVKMPGMDGYETYMQMKKRPKASDIPVIFLTADSENETELKGLELGAYDFIKKPYEPGVMIGRIERAIREEERTKTIKEAALKDSLTGVWNREYITKFIDSLDGSETGSFLILDLDNFKGVNDTYGHVVGDKALEAFARTLVGFVHKDDIVSRIGGDEFVVFLRNAYGKALLNDRITGLIKQVEKELSVVKADNSISSVSVGISAYPFDGENFLELYNCADKALYYVKRNGKSGCHFYDADEKLVIHEQNKDEEVDLNDLCNYMEDDTTEPGPYNCEYLNFKSIYKFLKRYERRSHVKMQVLLFTIKDLSLTEEKINAVPFAMELLDACIRESLRKNDVATRYSKSQYIVILMDVDDVNRQIVVDRIVNTFEKRNTNTNIILKYNIDHLGD